MMTAGCVFHAKGTLPEEPLFPTPLLVAERPALGYTVSFFPPDRERDAELTREFVQELTASGLFREVRSQPCDADVTMSVEMAHVTLSTGKTLLVDAFTGGLWPVRIPYRYELKAAVRDAVGQVEEYELTDEYYCRIWLPGLLRHGLGDRVEPGSPRLRRNLYRTLLRRMADDGLARS